MVSKKESISDPKSTNVKPQYRKNAAWIKIRARLVTVGLVSLLPLETGGGKAQQTETYVGWLSWWRLSVQKSWLPLAAFWLFRLWAAKSRLPRLSLKGVCMCASARANVCVRSLLVNEMNFCWLKDPHSSLTKMLVQVRIYFPGALLFGDWTGCHVMYRLNFSNTWRRQSDR